MGKKAKIISILFLVLLIGCAADPEDKVIVPDPLPTIELNEESISANGKTTTSVDVVFCGIEADFQGMHVRLETVEEVKSYKKELEFALNRLDEIEMKMLIQEPEEEL